MFTNSFLKSLFTLRTARTSGRYQAIDIYYSGVGIVYIPEPEESEMMFQEHLRNLEEKQNKEKTA